MFLALSLLPPLQADAFLNDVVNADLTLALHAVKYLDAERDEVVSKLLNHLHERIVDLRPFERAGIELKNGRFEWIVESIIGEGDPNSRYWLQERMSWLFATCLNREGRRAFVTEFNKSGSKYRTVLADSILLRQKDLTTEDFSPDAVSFLLANLSRVDIRTSWPGHLLGQTATEQFVTERLLPLVSGAEELLLRNLQEVLRQAGSRHGRRYLLD